MFKSVKNSIALLLMMIFLISLGTPSNVEANSFNELKENKARVQITKEKIIENEDYLSTSEDITDIKLDLLNVQVPYNAKDIDVKYIEKDDSVTAVILDKKTNEEIDIYTEQFEDEEIKNSAANNTVWRTLFRSKTYKPAAVEVGVRVQIWSSGSFRQFNKIQDAWQRPGNSGKYTLKSTRTFNNNKLPATKISINASGIIEVATNENITGTWSISSLKKYGFSISAGSKKTYYARKHYNNDFIFSLY
ncbi:hypothetical protein [Anaerosalibacter massiliensis]|uniref:hypothetical protein n=1 Tax=Anaerosalibacter massiliensis TaxID=1347392 RepID=UPI0005B2E7BE|nr:hypothetical protein [Anaerosalibacter massiliensis]